jgi:hypothetical protein
LLVGITAAEEQGAAGGDGGTNRNPRDAMAAGGQCPESLHRPLLLAKSRFIQVPIYPNPARQSPTAELNRE